MFNFLGKLLDSNEKEVKKLLPMTEAINSFEAEIAKLSDAGILAKTAEFKARLERGETLDGILPEAYALVREAAQRQIGERHFDVQLVAAIALHQGKIAEQKTGEGKTLSAVPALYLNALTGKGAHLVTVNDYLARRDSGWMGAIFHALGLTCAAIIHEESFIYDPEHSDELAQDWRLKHLRSVSRKEAYQADITYGINSEFGFDYLRDNMAQDLPQVVQRGFHFAVVDEVDSVLIDEARTPHIISAPDMEPTQRYYEYAKLVDKLTPKLDYVVDEKLRTAHLTEHGLDKIEKMYGMTNIYEKDFATVYHLEAALKARTLFLTNKDYVVRDGQVVIVDEFTGRLMPGRRWSEGIHQAVEAKEGVAIQQESKTLATISLQNYFRLYEKLAGMTGTAATEAEEFHKIYKLEVVVIPTNRPMVRKNLGDLIFKTQRAKYAAVVREIEECYKAGRPVLVGTTSIDKNEIISDFLRHKGVPHQVLNAKNHEKEATIISQAGTKGTVTVATNMAGRGVDIILGGMPPNKYLMADPKEYEKEIEKWRKNHEEVVEAGGLHVIGTERHESRRIDNQLRGRSGRQGDPGSSRFFVALDDEIMRLFGGDRIAGLMEMFKMPEDVPLEHGMVSKAIEQAQSKVEGFNFDARKHLVEYDDVMNKQREIIYAMRRKVLETATTPNPPDSPETTAPLDSPLKSEILEKIQNSLANIVAMYAPEGYSEPEREKIVEELVAVVPFDEGSQKQIMAQLEKIHTSEEISQFLTKLVSDIYGQREKQLTPEVMRQVEKWVYLSVIDNLWMDHLTAIEDLREGIGLRGYGQRDPLVEYKNEAYSMFERLMAAIDYAVVHRIFKVQVQAPPPMPRPAHVVEQAAGSQTPTPSKSRPQTQTSAPGSAPGEKHKLGRNDPCPCGSGKKWKKCHYPNLG
ncbi:MAG: preprotein translocase subunit SecA [bacterium]|nr:preprotein translocase subunit SecA [bacterium]